MLSEFILARLSYPAMPLAGQQVHQWSVQLGPLVLESNLLKNRTPAVDRSPTCLTLLSLAIALLSVGGFSHITVRNGLYIHPSLRQDVQHVVSTSN